MNLPSFMKPKPEQPPFPRFPNMGREVVPHDLDEEMRLTIANRLPEAPQLPSEYAPRRPIPHVETFMALPLEEIDAAMNALKVGYEEACKRGQKLRDLIMAAREEHIESIRREKAFAEATIKAFDVLAETYTGINQPEPIAQEQTDELPS